MHLASFWFRTTFARRWSTYVGTILLIGIIGGLSLFAFAGARRTQSAYPRFLRAVDASTMTVDTGGYDPDLIDAIANLPQVERSGAYLAPLVGVIGKGKLDISQDFEALASLDGRFFGQDRFVTLGQCRMRHRAGAEQRGTHT